jgi:hypothetical protein
VVARGVCFHRWTATWHSRRDGPARTSLLQKQQWNMARWKENLVSIGRALGLCLTSTVSRETPQAGLQNQIFMKSSGLFEPSAYCVRGSSEDARGYGKPRLQQPTSGWSLFEIASTIWLFPAIFWSGEDNPAVFGAIKVGARAFTGRSASCRHSGFDQQFLVRRRRALGAVKVGAPAFAG